MTEIETTEPPEPSEFTDPSPNADSDTNLAICCNLLLDLGVTRVVAHYSGSGDSGAVDQVDTYPEDVSVPPDVKDSLEELAESYCPDGYENEEGGYGTLTVYPLAGLAELDHHDRFTNEDVMDATPAPLPEELQQRLSGLGVTRVTAGFDGYGDSGQINEFSVEPDTVLIDDVLRQTLEDFLIGQLPGGWEINEGSFGHFVIDVPEGQVRVNASWRIDKEETCLTRWKWRT